jgi:quinolinate synthase
MTMEAALTVAQKNLDKKGYLDLDVDPTLDLFAEIERLKKEKNAIILAHYYQEAEIQDIADYIGDSLGLSQQAAAYGCGYHRVCRRALHGRNCQDPFILRVKCCCPISKPVVRWPIQRPPHLFRKFKEKYPDHKVVSYINCTAELKTMTDICCTSTNAVHIIE